MNSCILSVCIVSYNTSLLTLDAVRSTVKDIQRSPYLKKRSEIIIVDNNSSDDSVSILTEYKNTVAVPITIIKNKINTGFAKANNQAIKESQGKYILLLNSDTFVQPLTLEKMVLTFEEVKDQSSANLSSYSSKLDRLGILSATLIDPDGSFQAQGGAYPSLLSLAVHMLFLDDIPILGQFLPSTQDRKSYLSSSLDRSPSLHQKDWVAGTVMMIRKDLLNEIGVLDEDIFMYAEDMELCVRAKNHHWDIAIHPTAFVTHIKTASSSSAKAIEGEFKGYLFIWSKHKPIWQYQLVKVILTLGMMFRIVVFGTMGKKDTTDLYKNVWKSI